MVLVMFYRHFLADFLQVQILQDPWTQSLLAANRRYI